MNENDDARVVWPAAKGDTLSRPTFQMNEWMTSAKEALKKTGSVYLHNWNVGFLEDAIYWLTDLHLRKCLHRVTAFVVCCEEEVNP